MPILQVGLLGPVVAAVDGRPVAIPGARQAAVLACLALQIPRLVGTETLIAALWDEEFPKRAEQTLQQHISTLRTVLEPDRAPRAVSHFLITQAAGYRLDASTTDADEFEIRARRGEQANASGQWVAALPDLEAALTLWRGPVLAGLSMTPWFSAHHTRLTQRRLSVAQSRLQALQGLGAYDQLVGDCESLLTEHPLREGIWAQLMVGLYLGGRSADALAAYGRARRILQDELGLDPGEQLQMLERQILQRDPALESLRPMPAAPETEVAQTFRPGAGDVLPWIQLPDGQVVVLQPGIHTIGRQDGVSIRLQDSRVSRVHAQLTHRDGQVMITDLESTNATSVNGRPVTTELLLDQDRISVGGVPLIFRNAL